MPGDEAEELEQLAAAKRAESELAALKTQFEEDLSLTIKERRDLKEQIEQTNIEQPLFPDVKENDCD